MGSLIIAFLCLSAPAFAGSGRVKAWDGKTGLVTPDSPAGAKDLPIRMSGADPARMAVGRKVTYTDKWVFSKHFAGVTAVEAEKTEAKPAPAPVSEGPVAVVKTWDPVSKRGTMTPAAGGRDLVFALAPDAKVDVKVGAKVSYVEAFVTAPAP